MTGYEVTLEAIGGLKAGKAWVAEITGTHPKYRLNRQFMRGSIDNTVGNTTHLHFLLEEEKVYEISSPRSEDRVERFFVFVYQGRTRKMIYPEVIDFAKLLDMDKN